jgi:hypothetical protein
MFDPGQAPCATGVSVPRAAADDEHVRSSLHKFLRDRTARLRHRNDGDSVTEL